MPCAARCHFVGFAGDSRRSAPVRVAPRLSDVTFILDRRRGCHSAGPGRRAVDGGRRPTTSRRSAAVRAAQLELRGEQPQPERDAGAHERLEERERDELRLPALDTQARVGDGERARAAAGRSPRRRRTGRGPRRAGGRRSPRSRRRPAARSASPRSPGSPWHRTRPCARGRARARSAARRPSVSASALRSETASRARPSSQAANGASSAKTSPVAASASRLTRKSRPK